MASQKTKAKTGVAVLEKIGLTVSEPTPNLKRKFGLPETAKGIIVVDVDTKGPAIEKGIRPGDLIIEIGQKEVNTADDVKKQIDNAFKEKRRSILLLLRGQSGLRFVAIRLLK